MLLQDFYKTVIRTEDTAVAFLRQQNLLDASKKVEPCHKCGSTMQEKRKRNRKGEFMPVLRCPKSDCRTSRSVRKGCRFFHFTDLNNKLRCNLSICEILELVFLFVLEIPMGTAIKLTGKSSATISNWYNICREVCQAVVTQRPKMVGTEFDPVIIEEIKISGSRKPKDKKVGDIDNAEKNKVANHIHENYFGSQNYSVGGEFSGLNGQNNGALMTPYCEENIQCTTYQSGTNLHQHLYTVPITSCVTAAPIPHGIHTPFNPVWVPNPSQNSKPHPNQNSLPQCGGNNRNFNEDGPWVFGLKQGSDWRYFHVFKLDAGTVLPIIESNCEVGSVLLSKSLPPYGTLSTIGYRQSVANVGQTTSDALDETNSLISSKNQILRKSKSAKQAQSHLDHLCWKMLRKDSVDMFIAFLNDVRTVYRKDTNSVMQTRE